MAITRTLACHLGPVADLMLGALSSLSAELHRRSRKLVAFLDVRMETLIVGWIGAAVALGGLKVAFSPLPLQGMQGGLVTLLPYLLVALAPIAGYRLASGSFPRGLLSAQPLMRLCWWGSWRKLDTLAVRQNPHFGPAGLMASLIVGILLNVPLRTFEFILAVPAIAPGAPQWAQALLLAMTVDLVVMNFFYMVCFVMALRSIPLFPRMLLFAWFIDILMQLAIADYLSGMAHLPDSVGAALFNLLQGNIQKILISVAIWLPYLIVSERVNITFRHRVRA